MHWWFDPFDPTNLSINLRVRITMELIGLAVVIVLAIWMYDFDRPIQELANTANETVARISKEQKAANIKALSKLDSSFTDNDVTAAKSVINKLNSVDLFDTTTAG